MPPVLSQELSDPEDPRYCALTALIPTRNSIANNAKILLIVKLNLFPSLVAFHSTKDAIFLLENHTLLTNVR
jgi:hypothetical protein